MLCWCSPAHPANGLVDSSCSLLRVPGLPSQAAVGMAASSIPLGAATRARSLIEYLLLQLDLHWQPMLAAR